LAEVRVEGADSVQCPVVTQTEEHDFDDNQIPASDCGSAFNFTPVYIAPFGDHFGRLCPCAMSHIVSTDQIPSDTVSSHRCSCPRFSA
jgi:hypothetical protein